MKGWGRNLSAAEIKMWNKHLEDGGESRELGFRPRTQCFIKKNVSAEFLKAFQT